MARITNEKKEEIKKLIVAHKYSAERKAFEEKIFNATFKVLTDEIDPIRDELEKCDKYVVKTKKMIIVAERVGYNILGTFYLDKPYPSNSDRYDMRFYACDIPGGDKWEKEEMLLKKKEDELKELLKGILAACNTTKQLYNTLPEVEPIVKHLFIKDQAIVPISTVNATKAILSR